MLDRRQLRSVQLEDRPLEGAMSRRRGRTDSSLDITPMIDVTFLLLIFFLVAATIDSQAGLQLPTARNGGAISAQNAIVFTITGAGGQAIVYAGSEVDPAQRLSGEDDILREEITEAVQRGKLAGRSDILIMAERLLEHRHVAKVINAASLIDGMQLHLAVLEAH